MRQRRRCLKIRSTEQTGRTLIGAWFGTGERGRASQSCLGARPWTGLLVAGFHRVPWLADQLQLFRGSQRGR